MPAATASRAWFSAGTVGSSFIRRTLAILPGDRRRRAGQEHRRADDIWGGFTQPTQGVPKNAARAVLLDDDLGHTRGLPRQPRPPSGFQERRCAAFTTSM